MYGISAFIIPITLLFLTPRQLTTYHSKMSASKSSVSLQIAKDLWNETKRDSISIETCETLLNELEVSNVPFEKLSTVVRTLTALQKRARTERGPHAQRWKNLETSVVAPFLIALKQRQVKQTGYPASVNDYLVRLQSQKKELYKNPPCMPPAPVTVEPDSVGLPRLAKNNYLVFKNGQDKTLNLQLFCPNLSPEQVLRGGAFGGTYFRNITSAVTNTSYTTALADTCPAEWYEGMNVPLQLTSPAYQTSVNKYKVKCGGSLGMWESSGWIADSDPYGWFQWYCRFYQGRRCSDDARQVQRWLNCAGPKGRFRSQLCNKILAAGKSCSDASISPVIRQTLFHWGLIITDDVLDKHKKRLK